MKIVTINSMWCPACIVMHKVWKKVQEQNINVEFTNYDYDLDEDIVKTFNPGDILPVTIFFVNDIEVARLNGEKTISEINNIISQYK